MEQSPVRKLSGDEVELIDLLRVIWKRRRLILLGTALLTAIAAGVSFLLPKAYEISAILEPGTRPITDVSGQIIEEKNAESPEAIKENILGGAFNQEIEQRLNIPAEDFPKFRITIPQNTNLVKIVIESSHPERDLEVLREVVAMASAQIQEKLETEKDQLANEIDLARIENAGNLEKISLFEKQISATQEKIRTLWQDRKISLAKNPSDAMSVLLYSNEIQEQQMYLNDLQEKLLALRIQARGSENRTEKLHLKMASIKNTQVVKSPGLSAKPIRPKKPLIAALAFVLGMMTTTMVAFFLEYLEKNREEKVPGRDSLPADVGAVEDA